MKTRQDILNYVNEVRNFNRNFVGLYIHTLLKINFKEVDYFIDFPWVATDNSRVMFQAVLKNGEHISVVSHNKNNVWD